MERDSKGDIVVGFGGGFGLVVVWRFGERSKDVYVVYRYALEQQL